jgi:hypothetical protein
MKTLTPEQIIALGPCEGYNLQQITELFDNKKSVTYLEILNTDKIPLVDIIWLFCQPTILDNDTKEQWLEVIVTRAVTNYALHCGINKVEKWAQNWLSSEDRTAEAACSAAKTAKAADIAAYAAYYVDVADIDAAYGAYSAAKAAYHSRAAAYTTDAARAATYAAVYAPDDARAAGYAARKTEHKQQIEDLKELLKEDK